jgi:hypothetical protein
MNIQINLLNAYEIIKYIHSLYITYKKYIYYKSFESTGEGHDTIYNIYQMKNVYEYILICKIIKFYDSFIYLPMKIITLFGIWSFIDEPIILNNNNNNQELLDFKKELEQIIDLEFISPGFYNEYNKIFHPMFLIKRFKKNNFIITNTNTNINIDIQIYDYEYIKNQFEKLSDLYFNNMPYGPDIIDYKFNIFIKLWYTLNIIDDKCKYFHDCLNIINTDLQKNYINTIKSYYKNKKIYKYNSNKNIYRILFYYTYLNYFNVYTPKTLCDKFKINV